MVFQRVCHLLTTTIAFFLQLNHSNGTESSQIQNLPIVDSGLKWPKYIVESSTYCENFGRRGHCENRVFIHSGGRKTTFREAEGGFRGDFSPSQFTQFVRFCAKKKIIHSGLGCRTKCSQNASIARINSFPHCTGFLFKLGLPSVSRKVNSGVKNFLFPISMKDKTHRF